MKKDDKEFVLGVDVEFCFLCDAVRVCFNEYIVQSTVHFPVYMVFSRLDYPAGHNWIAFN